MIRISSHRYWPQCNVYYVICEVLNSVFCVYLSVCQTVPSNEQQRREAVPLQDHRLSSNQLPGKNWWFLIEEKVSAICLLTFIQWQCMTSCSPFQTDRPTVIEYDDHEYLFEGFSLFSHTPLTNVSLLRWVSFTPQQFQVFFVFFLQ